MKPRHLESSAALLEAIPELEEDPQWKTFAADFDAPSKSENRKNALAARWEQSSDIASRLRGLCSAVLRNDRFLPGVGHGLFQRQRAFRIAAKELARQVELALEGDGVTFLKSLNEEQKRAKDRKSRRHLTELKGHSVVLTAFARFVEREGRLPTKLEVNIEANRIYESEENPRQGIRHFGQKEDREGGTPDPDRRAETYCVYDCFKDFSEQDGDPLALVPMYTRVPLTVWKEPRWEPAGLSPYLAALGLKGLKEAPRGPDREPRRKRPKKG